MIIDAHCHLLGPKLDGTLHWEVLMNYGAAVSGTSLERVEERIKEQIDETGDLLVKDMDNARIDKAFVHLLELSLWRGTADTTSVENLHEILATVVNRHKNRLYAVGGVDPRRPDAAKFVERAVKEYGVIAVKLHPAFNSFYPNDRCCEPVYRKCQQLGIPVFVHTGPEIMPFDAKYTQPIFVDEVAHGFPDLTIILAHAGLCWWEEAATLSRTNPNMYLDTAYWQVKALGGGPGWEVFRQLRWVMSIAGRNKLLFGTDWPALRLVERVNHPNWIKLIKNPPPDVKKMGIEFTEVEINNFLGDNAARLFGIET